MLKTIIWLALVALVVYFLVACLPLLIKFFKHKKQIKNNKHFTKEVKK